MRNLCIRFEGNQSKCWGGKEALIEYDWLKEQVGATQLSPGNKVTIQWPTRGGEIQYWKGAVVNNDDASISDKKDGHNHVTEESSCVLSKRVRGSKSKQSDGMKKKTKVLRYVSTCLVSNV